MNSGPGFLSVHVHVIQGRWKRKPGEYIKMTLDCHMTSTCYIPLYVSISLQFTIWHHCHIGVSLCRLVNNLFLHAGVYLEISLHYLNALNRSRWNLHLKFSLTFKPINLLNTLLLTISMTSINVLLRGSGKAGEDSFSLYWLCRVRYERPLYFSLRDNYSGLAFPGEWNNQGASYTGILIPGYAGYI